MTQGKDDQGHQEEGQLDGSAFPVAVIEMPDDDIKDTGGGDEVAGDESSREEDEHGADKDSGAEGGECGPAEVPLAEEIEHLRLAGEHGPTLFDAHVERDQDENGAEEA